MCGFLARTCDGVYGGMGFVLTQCVLVYRVGFVLTVLAHRKHPPDHSSVCLFGTITASAPVAPCGAALIQPPLTLPNCVLCVYVCLVCVDQLTLFHSVLGAFGMLQFVRY